MEWLSDETYRCLEKWGERVSGTVMKSIFSFYDLGQIVFMEVCIDARKYWDVLEAGLRF